MTTPMIDLFRPYMNPGAAERVAKVLTYDAKGRIFCGQGPLVDEFEGAFADLVGAKPATVVTTNSCTAALDLALHSCGIQSGDEVVSTPQTCTATNGVIVNRGARIVWADIDPATGLIDPRDVARKVTPNTRAIMAVDWAGNACDYARLRLHGIPVIEDAAHATLTRYAGESIARSGGDYVCYSFGPIKHLTCSDGGALVTHRGDAERLRLLRWHGLSRTSSADFRCAQTIDEAGYKYHLTDFNAAVGLANIPDAAWVVGKHRENAAWYDRALAGLPGVALPPADPGSSYWLYCLLVNDRDAFIAHLKARGIASSPVHRRNDVHPAYHFPNGPLPGVDHYDSHVAAIPVGWWIGPRELARVADAVKEWAYSQAKQVAA